ncbi:hypothetical protein TSTA_017870 [Talaromyces stipitatus ATCC 10500]|uniref:Uncharacterized protein n=1 Tax=Talaromyces stipitatus (strain ATCC 10500 / CBS 375.48 / QM 6759 / NRRL 1006) TaxID=441959 RepID=B8MFH9_TALSN|nr:uncharacterized protein TSTA_017870 [Talaromyces stipitatus ATCC 10500]EED16713.1 hypothetical protein TSTA_017870 [Talaromyces stipitatus ATCC 10500]
MSLRHANVVPCLNNIAYYSKEADLLPANPVLGILHFTFHSEVDVSESSQAASILWRKSLKFVSTIFGFQSLYWAPIIHNSPCQQIIVLIQWDSGRGWKLFQFSLGFSMMLGYVQSVFNRCIQLALPSDLLHFDSVLEMISFQFPTMLSTSQIDMEPVFKDKWETEFVPYLSTSTAMAQLSHACGEWVEWFDIHVRTMFFWKPDTQLGNKDNIADQIAEMGKYATDVVSVYTSQLNQASSETFQLQASDLLQVTVQSQDLMKVNQHFQNPVKPEFNLDDSTLRREDLLYSESIREVKRNERIACGPAGFWYPMGHISQHNLHQEKYDAEINMKMISFRARIGNAPVDSLFEGLEGSFFQFLERLPNKPMLELRINRKIPCRATPLTLLLYQGARDGSLMTFILHRQIRASKAGGRNSYQFSAAIREALKKSSTATLPNELKPSMIFWAILSICYGHYPSASLFSTWSWKKKIPGQLQTGWKNRDVHRRQYHGLFLTYPGLRISQNKHPMLCEFCHFGFIQKRILVKYELRHHAGKTILIGRGDTWWYQVCYTTRPIVR